MTAALWSVIISGTLTVVGVIIGGIVNARGNRRVTEAESKSSPYEALASRVATLEQSDESKRLEITRLREENSNLAAIVTRHEALISRYAEYYKDLQLNWPIYQKNDKPPAISTLWYLDSE